MKERSKRPTRRVLVIDDNPSIHGDFRKILEGRGPATASLAEAAASLLGDQMPALSEKPFDLAGALQGQEGLDAVREALAEGRPFSMAFVDVRMPPGWDGIETTSRIWEADPDLPVVICTAYADYDLDEIVAQLGMSDRFVILKKPFDPIEAVQLANALAEKRRLHEEIRGHVEELERTVRERTVELAESEERFRLIAETAADLIGLVDRSGRRVYFSPSFDRVLGLPGTPCAADGFLDLIHPEDRARVGAVLRKTLEQNSAQVSDCRLRRASGGWLDFEAHLAPFHQAGAASDCLLVVARDVTERLRAEREREAMASQLRQAQKLEAIGQLAAGIAHEINTPTQYVGDNTRFLQDGFGAFEQALLLLDRLIARGETAAICPSVLEETKGALATLDLPYLREQVPRAIKETLEGVERVAKIVRAMKEFSHPGSKEKSSADLRKCIESTVTVARNEWKYVAELTVECDPDLPLVPCFAGELNQALLNLVVNAAQAIAEALKDRPGEKGRISITAARSDDWVEIRVADTGAGIPSAARAHIFEPFFTTKPVGKGTGQGLSVVYAVVVQKHHGEVRFETEVGSGTTFILRLPLQARQAPENPSAIAS